MNTYQYKITNIERDLNGIAVACSFDITVSDGVDSLTHNFHTGFTPPPVNPIPFNQLTQTEVIGWVQALVGKDSEQLADGELQAFKSRKNILTGLPW